MFFLILPVIFCLIVIWANILNDMGIFGFGGTVGAILILLGIIKKNKVKIGKSFK
jgi:NADH:ubiquinone oxidoreductase subunit 3 (subunit A)